VPPRIYPTVAEAIEIQKTLIDEFGGFHGIRDMALLESAIFRPQNGYYNGIIEEAAALMESLAKNHAFIDGNKRISFVLTDVMLSANGISLDVPPLDAHSFIEGSLDRHEFNFVTICAWLASVTKPHEESAQRKPRQKVRIS
jgi:death on curing protein